jgi:hypothetical protein
MRRPTVQDASRRTHNNKFRHHEAATDHFGRPAEHRCGLQQRTIARATRKSGESHRVRSHTYCPGTRYLGTHLANAGWRSVMSSRCTIQCPEAKIPRLRMVDCVRMVCTRQRCQVAPSTQVIALRKPSCASEITSLTPPTALDEALEEGQPERLGLRGT